MKKLIILFITVITLTGCPLLGDLLSQKNTDTYSVQYNGNTNGSGTVPSDNGYYEEGERVTVLGSGTMTKEGFQFAGWDTEINGQGIRYTAGDSFIMPAGDCVLFAQWEEDVITEDDVEGIWRWDYSELYSEDYMSGELHYFGSLNPEDADEINKLTDFVLDLDPSGFFIFCMKTINSEPGYYGGFWYFYEGQLTLPIYAMDFTYGTHLLDFVTDPNFNIESPLAIVEFPYGMNNGNLTLTSMNYNYSEDLYEVRVFIEGTYEDFIF